MHPMSQRTPEQNKNMKESNMLSHAVYFTMKDKGSIDSLIKSCRTHLTDHPGAISFAVGRCASEYDRQVNDRAFDVALEIIFESHCCPRHLPDIGPPSTIYWRQRREVGSGASFRCDSRRFRKSLGTREKKSDNSCTR